VFNFHLPAPVIDPEQAEVAVKPLDMVVARVVKPETDNARVWAEEVRPDTLRDQPGSIDAVREGIHTLDNPRRRWTRSSCLLSTSWDPPFLHNVYVLRDEDCPLHAPQSALISVLILQQ
jgi:hypothetical protein